MEYIELIYLYLSVVTVFIYIPIFIYFAIKWIYKKIFNDSHFLVTLTITLLAFWCSGFISPIAQLYSFILPDTHMLLVLMWLIPFMSISMVIFMYLILTTNSKHNPEIKLYLPKLFKSFLITNLLLYIGAIFLAFTSGQSLIYLASVELTILILSTSITCSLIPFSTIALTHYLNKVT